MTASLIDPAAVAAIKANPRRPKLAGIVAPDDCALSPARAARLTDREWRRAWIGATDVLSQCIDEALTRNDGTELAARLLNHSLNLFAYALTEFAGASADPRRNVRSKTDQILQVTWEGMNRTIDAGVEEYAGEVHTQMTAAADAAAREATDARRALDAASAQLTREREEWAREIKRLEGVLAAERSATINRERTARNEIHQLQQDLAASRTVIASLNTECERLEAQAAAPEPVEELRMSRPTNALESASLCLFLRERLGRPELTWDSGGVNLLHQESGAIAAEWRVAYPTPEAMLRQLRAVVRSILARAAA